MSSETIVIVVVVLVVILIVGSIAAAVFLFAPFNQISRVSSGPGPVQVTGLFLAVIYPSSASNSYFGSTYRFLYVHGASGPFYFQHREVFQTNFTLTLGGTSDHSIDSMTLAFSGGFSLQSTSPTTPVTVTHGSTMSFTVTLQAPESDYVGPVTIDLFTH